MHTRCCKQMAMQFDRSSMLGESLRSVFSLFVCKTYDGIEAYLKSNTFVAQRLGVERLPGHSVIARGMAKMPTSYIRLISRLVTLQMRGRSVDVAVDSSRFSLKTSSK